MIEIIKLNSMISYQAKFLAQVFVEVFISKIYENSHRFCARNITTLNQSFSVPLSCYKFPCLMKDFYILSCHHSSSFIIFFFNVHMLCHPLEYFDITEFLDTACSISELTHLRILVLHLSKHGSFHEYIAKLSKIRFE